MQRYIQQLIEDFKNAGSNPVYELDSGSSDFGFEQIIYKIENDERVSAKQLLGVDYFELPPADRMTVQQTQDLLEAMLNALNAKGTGVSFPGNGVPVKLAYTELRNKFKEGFYSLPGWHIDFCSGWCPDCAFVDYCNVAKENWTDKELEKERKKQ